jgi:thioredoxin reductase (NADPH)
MPGFPRLRDRYDVVIVGGGHAGLQAGLKSALLRKSAVVLDRGPKYSRSYYAPNMANIPGFPDGISGHKLLDLQIEALRKVGEFADYITPAKVRAASRSATGFSVEFDWLAQARRTEGRALVLAMGVVDRIVEVNGQIDPIFPWANQGIVHFCVLCDGHDLPGRSLAVLGHDAYAARSALELALFAPSSVVLLTHGHRPLEGVSAEERAELERELAAKSITWNETPIVGFDGIRERRFGVKFADGTSATYDRGFSALGWYDMHHAIPRALGCRLDAAGYVETDDDCRALSEKDGQPIPGLYVVGDLRSGWNQIPEAWAAAERAVIHAWAEYL